MPDNKPLPTKAILEKKIKALIENERQCIQKKANNQDDTLEEMWADLIKINKAITYSTSSILSEAATVVVYKAMANLEKNTPPKPAINLMNFLLPKQSREHLIGDIEEEFPEQVENLGILGAKAWVWKESLFCIFNILLDWIKSKLSIVDAVRKITGGK